MSLSALDMLHIYVSGDSTSLLTVWGRVSLLLVWGACLRPCGVCHCSMCCVNLLPPSHFLATVSKYSGTCTQGRPIAPSPGAALRTHTHTHVHTHTHTHTQRLEESTKPCMRAFASYMCYSHVTANAPLRRGLHDVRQYTHVYKHAQRRGA